MTDARLPQAVDDPSAWTAGDFGRSRSWVRALAPDMIEEIAAATARAMARGTPFFEISREDFPLPKTGELLRGAYDDMEDRRGFAVLEGWPVDEFDYDQNRVAFCGIAAHFGRPTVQNYQQDMIVDVIDDGVPYSYKSRGYQSNKLLPFHSDGADVAALCCLEVSAEGGKSVIASVAALYNAIGREKPEYLPLFARGFYHHRRGQHDEGEPPLSPERIPVFMFNDGHLHCCYNRNPIDWVEKEGMRLSEEEVAALDYLDSVLARPEMQLAMDLRKGDMQFLNNFVILHSRTEYRDDADHRRHLMRLWLDNDDSKRNGLSLLDLYVPGRGRFHAA